MDDSCALRKYQNNLIVSGTAVIIFGLWDLLRVIMILVIDPGSLKTVATNLLKSVGGDFNADDVLGASVVIVVIVLVVVLFDLLVRFYIARSANKEAKGKKKGWLYVIVALLMAFSLISDLISDDSIFSELTEYSEDIGPMQASVLVTLTSVFALLDLAWSSFKVKKLRKAELRKGEQV